MDASSTNGHCSCPVAAQQEGADVITLTQIFLVWWLYLWVEEVLMHAPTKQGDHFPRYSDENGFLLVLL